MTSPLILLSIWRGDYALVQSPAFCSTNSTIEYIQPEVSLCSFFLQSNKEYLKNTERDWLVQKDCLFILTIQ